jgi:hypothetical protein
MYSRMLPQNANNLLFRKLGSLHCPHFGRPDSNFNWRKSAGAGHRDGKLSFIACVLAADSTRSNVLMDT